MYNDILILIKMIESSLLRERWQKFLLIFLIAGATVVSILYVVLKEDILIYVMSGLWGVIILWLVSFFFTELSERYNFININTGDTDLDMRRRANIDRLNKKLDDYDNYTRTVIPDQYDQFWSNSREIPAA